MGISNWASLLVYQRYDMSWKAANILAKEDEDMPTMYCISIGVPCSVKNNTKALVSSWRPCLSMIQSVHHKFLRVPKSHDYSG
jgi:hypothetical protein